MTSLGACTSRCLLIIQSCSCLRPRLVSFQHYSTSAVKSKNLDPKDKWNYNRTSLGAEPTSVQVELKQVDSNTLEHESMPPTGVRMLARDFIEDSLYNPHYGYFPRQAIIFDTQASPFDFNKLRDSAEFQEQVAKRYAAYGADKHHGPGKQLWHTPTELFKVCINGVLLRYDCSTSKIAILWSSSRKMPCVGISAQILPIRRLRHLRNWCREWFSGRKHP